MYSIESAKIVEQIEEIVRSLALRYGARVERNVLLPHTMSYNPFTDCIYYNPYEIKKIYEKLSKHPHVRLMDLIEYVFGHELGHRKKYKKLTEYEREQALKIVRSLYILCTMPEKAESLLPEHIRPDLPFYRLCAIAQTLFEEYYAVKENPLRKWSIERVGHSVITNNLKRNLREVRGVLRTLSYNKLKYSKYFITPLAYLPIQSLKVFPHPEYLALRKIKTFLLQNIITAQDVFDLKKMVQVANIILCELEGKHKIPLSDEFLRDELKDVVYILYEGWLHGLLSSR